MNKIKVHEFHGRDRHLKNDDQIQILNTKDTVTISTWESKETVVIRGETGKVSVWQVKDLEWREGEKAKRRGRYLGSWNSTYRTMEVRNKTICVISRFRVAREEQKVTGGNGTGQDENVWSEHWHEKASGTTNKRFWQIYFPLLSKISRVSEDGF